jgi:hypothetical protein
VKLILRIFIFLVLAAGLAVGGCIFYRIERLPLKLQPGTSIRSVDPGSQYNKLYPFYAEVCAVSQMKGLNDKPGGPEGHVVLWLEGVCRDEAKPYPALKLGTGCGTGVSVNKIFENVNWVAVPDRELFFRGDLKPGETLTEAKRKEALTRALAVGLYKGVKIHPKYLDEKPDSMNMEEFVAKKGLGTDFALSFGRSVLGFRVPLTQAMMQRLVNFLNEMNKTYFSSGREYEWSGYYNNCAHTVHNALAAAGIWKSKSTNVRRFVQLFNLAVPANEFANLALLSTKSLPENVSWIIKDKILRNALNQDAWLPMEPGALFSSIPVHQPNELYDTQFSLYVLEGRIFLQQKSRKIRELVKEKRFTDLRANLEYYKTRYEDILKKKKGDSAIEKSYYAYLEKQLEDIKLKLTKISTGES